MHSPPACACIIPAMPPATMSFWGPCFSSTLENLCSPLLPRPPAVIKPLLCLSSCLHIHALPRPHLTLPWPPSAPLTCTPAASVDQPSPLTPTILPHCVPAPMAPSCQKAVPSLRTVLHPPFSNLECRFSLSCRQSTGMGSFWACVCIGTLWGGRLDSYVVAFLQ